VTEGGNPDPSAPQLAQGDLRLAVEHAREWVRLHADQRLRAVNFWLVSVAFLTTAYVTSFPNAKPLAAGVALAGVVVTFALQRMERRTRELVKYGEDALRPLEDLLAFRLGMPEIRLVARAEKPTEWFTSYARVIALMQWSGLAWFLLALFGTALAVLSPLLCAS
jgi:hypothetical protein